MPDEKKLAPKNPKAFVASWLKEVDDALKREKKYRELGKHSVQIYEAKDPASVPFNILYSNTETLAPAVYNSLPIPIVERKFKDADPVGKSVSEVSTRILKFLLSNEDKDYDCFDDLIQAAVVDSIVTNRGLCRFRYYAHDDEGADECVYGESVRWDKFFHGYARTWKKVPWVGFEWDMSREELKTNFPDAKFADLRSVSDASEDPDEQAESKDELAGVKTYKVFEIWDKASGMVFFISRLAPDAPLRYVKDPLGLSNFFPVPKPLNFMKKITTLVPTPLYEQYRQQAAELNDITNRLKAIIKAIRFRGAYNAAVDGIEKMLNAEDNELVPVENVQSMPDGTGMDRLLWVVPVNELAMTAQALYQQRESIKQAIYEITGISDILRGASAASETLGAQQIKTQWGSLRIKRMQREVQRYCRDAIAIILEIAAVKFDLTTIQKMTGLQYMTNAQKQQASEAIQAFQAATAAAQQAGQQPPQMPNIPPELMQAYKLPSWEDVLQVMHDRIMFHYKVDIETNSTIDAEAAQDKQDIAELMNAISQFLNGVAPLVQEGAMSIDVAKAMLLTICRRYNFGPQLEDAINTMQAPQPKADPNEQAKTATENAKMQSEQMKAKLDMQKMEMEMRLAQQKAEQEKELMILEHQLKLGELEIKRQEAGIQKQNLAAKAESQALQHNMKMEAIKSAAKQKEMAGGDA